MRAADGEHVVVVDQGARAAGAAGFVTLGDFALNAASKIVIEDNVDVAPPADRKRIMGDAFRVVAVPPPPPPPPEDPIDEDPFDEDPVDEDPVDEDPVEDPVDEDPSEEKPTDEQPGEGDPGEVDPQLSDETRYVEVNSVPFAEGGCAQSGTSTGAIVALATLLLVRRRRR